MSTTAWRERAYCKDTDPELFFPGTMIGAREAKRICSRCPVKAECLEFALDHFGDYLAFGIWGETSDGDRQRIRIERAKNAKGADIQAGAA